MRDEVLQRLHSAASRGDMVLIQELLPSMRMTKQKLKEELSHCLFLAVKSCQVGTVQLLVRYGADIMQAGQGGERLIHLAAQSGSVDVLRAVIRAGSAVNVADDRGCVALHFALKNDDEASVNLLLNEGAHLTRPKEWSTGQNPMHFAARFCKMAHIMRRMIAKGGNVNCKSSVGEETPLHLAVKERHFAIVQLLCESGANIEAVDSKGNTPLHVAVQITSVEMVRTLLRYGASPNTKAQISQSQSPLHLVSIRLPTTDSRLDVAHLLVEYGADIEAVDASRLTALHNAALVGSIRMCECLLQLGANINVVDASDNTALNLAISSNKFECALMLIHEGADIWLSDSSLKTPLHKALMAISTDEMRFLVIEELLKRGALVNQRCINGISPLDSCICHFMIGQIDSRLIRLVVEAGAILKPNTDPGRSIRHSSLCWLTGHGNLKLAEYLILCGWDLTAEDWIRMPGKNQKTVEFLEWIRQIASEPRPLKVLCRNAIRYHMVKCSNDTDISSLMHKLPLPKIIIRYLTLKDEYEQCSST